MCPRTHCFSVCVGDGGGGGGRGQAWGDRGEGVAVGVAVVVVVGAVGYAKLGMHLGVGDAQRFISSSKCRPKDPTIH